MPIVVSDQGWVRLPPAPRKKATKANPVDVLRGPLAYITGQNVPSKRRPLPPKEISHHQVTDNHIPHCHRTVSAPQYVTEEREPQLREESEADQQVFEVEPVRRSVSSAPRAPPSVSSSTSSSSSRSGKQSYTRSRPRPPRSEYEPIVYEPRPSSYYRDYSSSHREAPSHHRESSSHYRDLDYRRMYAPTPSNRSVSLSWANATQPLNIN